MYTIRASAETVIARPIDIVQSQFADMAHHANVGVHASLEVDNVRPTHEGCLFTGRRRVLGRLQEDEMELRRNPDGGSVLRSLAGTNAGLVIAQSFEALGPAETRVRTTVDAPLPGIARLLAPLLRAVLRRDLRKALAEDRHDLEVRGYPAAAVSESQA